MRGGPRGGVNPTLRPFLLRGVVWLSTSWDPRLGTETLRRPIGFQWLRAGAQVITVLQERGFMGASLGHPLGEAAWRVMQ